MAENYILKIQVADIPKMSQTKCPEGAKGF